MIVLGFAEQTSAMRLCMQWRAYPYTVQWSGPRTSTRSQGESVRASLKCCI